MASDSRKPFSGYLYDPGEGRHKHHWSKRKAGFVEDQGELIGKCPKGLSDALLDNLLHDAIPENVGGWRKPYPKRGYNVHKGVVYVAVPTAPGRSYHGYPWRKRPNVPRDRIPASILDELRRRSDEQGYLRQFENWLKRYGE